MCLLPACVFDLVRAPDCTLVLASATACSLTDWLPLAGFNISLNPSFDVRQLVFLQNYGGILAIPNLR